MTYISPYVMETNDAAIAAGRTGTPKVYAAGGDYSRGSITWASIQVQDETITLDGVYVKFTSAASDGTAAGTALDPLLVNIKGSLTLTLDELVIVLNATANATIAVATYAKSGTTILTIVYDTRVEAGNSYTLAASVGTVSGTTLTGGYADVAISPDTENVEIAITDDNNQYFTLALAPKFTRKTIAMLSKGTGNAIITPAAFTDGTTITLDTALDYVQLQVIGTAWKVVGTSVATIA